MELAPEVEGDKYGGLRFGLTVTLLHTALAEELAGFPADKTGLDDSPERMAAFERELASRGPRYGALQRS